MLLNSGQVLTERAKIGPRVEAIVDTASGARCDFRQLNDRTNQTANTLLAMEFSPGERIACLMPNQAQYVESFYACAKAGFVFVALNWRLSVTELSYQLMDSGAVAVLYAAEQKALVDPLRQQFPHIRWLTADEGDYAAAVATAATTEPPIGATGTDPLYMMYTSGTTGRPKGALMSHAANIAWLASMLATSDLRHGERNIIVAPLFHIGGLGLAMSAVYRGMTTVLLKQFDPGVMWDLVAAEKITGFFAVPAMLALMYQHPKRTTTARPALRWVLCGAAPVPVNLIEAYLAMGVEILQVYGLTETHGGICLMSAEHARTKVGSTGMPYFGIDVRVVDKAGTPVPPGIPGEVVTRGPHLISGYWNRPEATREAIREGWFHTGDIAEVDTEGFIYIKDRSKDMVITGGENVYPAEVEDVLGGHAGVREVGVIGQPSPRWGESVCAVIVRGDDWKGDDEVLVQELRALVQSRLARFKQPKTYVFMNALPRNPSGKILKRLLREQFPGPAPE
jgi:acyl-CoA synthetase (AMP-forming)/AMP-acid ligase II